jgi:hypothetical protein
MREQQQAAEESGSLPKGRACNPSHLALEVPLENALERSSHRLCKRTYHVLVHAACAAHILLSQKWQQSVVHSTPRIATHPVCGWACVADVSMLTEILKSQCPRIFCYLKPQES